MNKKGTNWIKVFAWLTLISGLLSLINVFTLKGKLLSYQASYFAFPESYYYVNVSWSLVGGVLGVVAGIGLLTLQNWGRFLVIGYEVFDIIYLSALHFIYTEAYTIPFFRELDKPIVNHYMKPTIGILWSLFMIYYFTRGRTIKQFN